MKTVGPKAPIMPRSRPPCSLRLLSPPRLVFLPTHKVHSQQPPPRKSMFDRLKAPVVTLLRRVFGCGETGIARGDENEDAVDKSEPPVMESVRVIPACILEQHMVTKPSADLPAALTDKSQDIENKSRTLMTSANSKRRQRLSLRTCTEKEIASLSGGTPENDSPVGVSYLDETIRGAAEPTEVTESTQEGTSAVGVAQLTALVTGEFLELYSLSPVALASPTPSQRPVLPAPPRTTPRVPSHGTSPGKMRRPRIRRPGTPRPAPAAASTRTPLTPDEPTLNQSLDRLRRPQTSLRTALGRPSTRAHITPAPVDSAPRLALAAASGWLSDCGRLEDARSQSPGRLPTNFGEINRPTVRRPTVRRPSATRLSSVFGSPPKRSSGAYIDASAPHHELPALKTVFLAEATAAEATSLPVQRRLNFRSRVPIMQESEGTMSAVDSVNGEGGKGGFAPTKRAAPAAAPARGELSA
jgi:hypothetical protein